MKEGIKAISSFIYAAGTYNLVVERLNNTVAEGAISGDAHFESKVVGQSTGYVKRFDRGWYIWQYDSGLSK